MNQDEILKIIGPVNYPVGIGGYDSDNYDGDCQIYNLVLFDGKDSFDEILENDSIFFRISHGKLSEYDSQILLSYSNLEIIHDEQWDLKQLLTKIQEKRDILFSSSTKNSLVESQFALSKAKTALETNDPFLSCWIKCAGISLIDSVLLQNKIIPNPAYSLSLLRNLKNEKNNQFSEKIISETGVERATSSLLTRMLKSSCGFSDMIENNQNSKIIEKKAKHMIENSLLSDCYLYLTYQNKNNFYKIKNSLNLNSEKIHVLKTAFDLTNSSSELQASIDSMSDITNKLLKLNHSNAK